MRIFLHKWVWWSSMKTWTTAYILYGIWLFFYIIPLVISKHYILTAFAVVTFVISLITLSMANTRDPCGAGLQMDHGFIATDKWCKNKKT